MGGQTAPASPTPAFGADRRPPVLRILPIVGRRPGLMVHCGNATFRFQSGSIVRTAAIVRTLVSDRELDELMKRVAAGDHEAEEIIREWIARALSGDTGWLDNPDCCCRKRWIG